MKPKSLSAYEKKKKPSQIQSPLPLDPLTLGNQIKSGRGLVSTYLVYFHLVSISLVSLYWGGGLREIFDLCVFVGALILFTYLFIYWRVWPDKEPATS